jgi:two-component system, OmpR family, sensor histidine kinase KdpD
LAAAVTIIYFVAAMAFRFFYFRGLSKGRQLLYGLSTILLVGVLCFLFSDLIGYRTVSFILLLTVSLLAISMDILPVLICAAVSAFAWNFFFIPPRFTFHMYAADDTQLFFMYFIIALVNAVLTYKLRQIEKDARSKEEKANSIALYNTILDSLSHELRTPLAAIIGATDNLQSNKALSVSHKEELIGEVSKAALRLNQQVENLLNISRLESGHIKPRLDWCDIGELIYEVVRRVEEVNHGRSITINTDPSMPICNTDKGMVDQVIYNLLNNAAIHTPTSFDISIKAACYGDVLEIVIEDGGPQMVSTNWHVMLQPMTKSKRQESGNAGLGLSIVRGFTDALRGSIQVNANANGGSTFTINIPVKTSNMHLPQ